LFFLWELFLPWKIRLISAFIFVFLFVVALEDKIEVFFLFFRYLQAKTRIF